MKLLAIEGSSARLSLAAFEGQALLAELHEEAHLRPLEALAPLCRRLLDERGWKAKDLNAVAVSLGPGSFTGLRSSLAFAKALCFAAGAKLVGVPTLEAWAEGEREAEVWLDARRGQVYRGIYEGGQSQGAPGMLARTIAETERLPQRKVLGDVLEPKGHPSAAKVGRLALKRLALGSSDDLSSLEPIYMRRPEAELLWEKRHGSAGPKTEFIIESLKEEDLEEVVALEQESFATPWSKALFLEELKKEGLCYWFKARVTSGPERVSAYMGFWRAVDEAHITNLAVRAGRRRLGLGRALAQHLLAEAKRLGCLRATLEVRPSNLAALRLYEALGFSSVAIRPKYYIDNEEDALIMWKQAL